MSDERQEIRFDILFKTGEGAVREASYYATSEMIGRIADDFQAHLHNETVHAVYSVLDTQKEPRLLSLDFRAVLCIT